MSIISFWETWHLIFSPTFFDYLRRDSSFLSSSISCNSSTTHSKFLLKFPLDEEEVKIPSPKVVISPAQVVSSISSSPKISPSVIAAQEKLKAEQERLKQQQELEAKRQQEMLKQQQEELQRQQQEFEKQRQEQLAQQQKMLEQQKLQMQLEHQKQLQAQQEALKEQQEKMKAAMAEQQSLKLSTATTTTASSTVASASSSSMKTPAAVAPTMTTANEAIKLSNDKCSTVGTSTAAVTTLTTTTTSTNTNPSYIRPPIGHKPVTSVLQTGDDESALMMNWRTRERQWEMEELDREKQLELERERAAKFAQTQREKARREKEKALREIEEALYLQPAIIPAQKTTSISTSTMTKNDPTNSKSSQPGIKSDKVLSGSPFNPCTHARWWGILLASKFPIIRSRECSVVQPLTDRWSLHPLTFFLSHGRLRHLSAKSGKLSLPLSLSFFFPYRWLLAMAWWCENKWPSRL